MGSHTLDWLCAPILKMRADFVPLLLISTCKIFNTRFDLLFGLAFFVGRCCTPPWTNLWIHSWGDHKIEIYFILYLTLDDEKPEDVPNTRHKNCPVSLRPCARDAYLLFQVRPYDDQTLSYYNTHWLIWWYMNRICVNWQVENSHIGFMV